jgi:glycosyltransferase involved in cell wall biosynthesis
MSSTVVFWNKDVPRATPPTYTNINYVTGFSGTETTVTEVATILAQNRLYRVYVVCHQVAENEPILDNGVTYLANLPEDMQVDVFIPMFFVQSPAVCSILQKLQHTGARVVLWMECILRPRMWQMCLPLLNADRTLIVAPSNFALQSLPRTFFRRYVVPNALNPAIYPPVTLDDHSERLGNWTFHACWERGGEVALRVFMQYAPRNKFHASGYPNAANRGQSDVRHYGTLSKYSLREVMMRCDYFVYPLVAPSGAVHHDTFGCAVLEAMACGAIVITWNVACLPECYTDYAILLEPPPYRQGSAHEPFGFNDQMNEDAAVQRLLQAVQRLDENPSSKEALRKRAMHWATSQTWSRSAVTFERILHATD